MNADNLHCPCWVGMAEQWRGARSGLRVGDVGYHINSAHEETAGLIALPHCIRPGWGRWLGRFTLFEIGKSTVTSFIIKGTLHPSVGSVAGP